MSPATLPQRRIGNTNVPAIGFGAMSLGGNVYHSPEGTPSDEEYLKVLDAVYERGCTHIDTANAYNDSEVLIGKWLKKTGKRSEVFLATKFGFFSPNDKAADLAWVTENLDASLSRLGVESVDLWYLHRANPEVPIEEVIACMAELVKVGKTKYIGLSEVSAKTLRRAHAVHPIAALQVEFSPFTLDIMDEKIALLKTARELGVTVIAYSPLGRGLLTGQYKGPEDFAENDFRRMIPRYSAENWPNIMKLTEELRKVGAKHGATSGQVALAWLLAQGDDIIPIPGTNKVRYLEENIGALDVKLTKTEVEEITKIAWESDAVTAAGGPRYPSSMMHLLFADTPAL